MPAAGALLVQLGSPAAPTPREVRRYLREFLGDPRVLDLPALSRRLLLELGILPWRSRRSAAAYRSIWTPAGSPLLAHSLALRDAVRQRLPDVPVELGMRYGKPSLAAALAGLRAAGCRDVVVLPLYPQYAASTTGSALAAVLERAAGAWDVPHIHAAPPFHADPGFLEAWRQVAAPALTAAAAEHVLFSFHGLPERQVRRSDPTGGHCLAGDDCCAEPGPWTPWCYRSQCLATARDLAQVLELAPGTWSWAFQSRLGRTAWLGPPTAAHLQELARTGCRRVAVLCPSFVADCLETLEEIGLRGGEVFRRAGGEALHLVPSLNAAPPWAEAVATLLRRELAAVQASAPPPATGSSRTGSS